MNAHVRWIATEPNGRGMGWRVGPAWLGIDPGSEETAAHARLIAAAPDLLAALRALDECYCEASNEMSRAQRAHHRKVLIDARAAIAKAAGAPA